MYGRLRGVDEKSLEEVVDSLVKNLLLSDHAHKQAGHSGIKDGGKQSQSNNFFVVILIHIDS